MSYLSTSDRLGAGYGTAVAFSVVVTSSCVTAGAMLFGFIVDPASFSPAALLFAPLYFMFAAAICTVAAVVLGLPLTLLLASRNLERPWSYPLAGLIGGIAVVIQLFGLGRDFLVLAFLGGLAGAICGLTWWRFHRRHFQDQGAELG